MQTESVNILNTLSLNLNEISQDKLNIIQKDRSNLFPWNGQFSPQLVETFLASYASPKAQVFDPFLGSGTVLVECAVRNIAAKGTEINPTAHHFASTYEFCSKSKVERESEVEHFENLLKSIFKIGNLGGEELCQQLLKKHSCAESLISKHIIKTLLLLLDYKTKPVDKKRFDAAWNKLKSVILTLPHSTKPLSALNRDARYTGFKKDTFDLVITSPPYINVFNYHQNYRATSEEFGHDLLEVAKAEIGSNRKHRGNRFLTVIQYILDMALVFDELSRVCTEDARVIFVVGRESNVRKTRFFNGEIITNIASRCCEFEPIMRQERVFKNRFGANIVEDIIHFKPRDKKLTTTEPYRIAEEVLISAKSYVSDEASEDLKDALIRLREVKASPKFDSSLSNGVTI